MIIKNIDSGEIKNIEIPTSDNFFRYAGNGLFSPNDNFFVYSMAHCDPNDEHLRTYLVNLNDFSQKKILNFGWHVVRWLNNEEILLAKNGSEYFIFNVKEKKIKKLNFETN
jgi:hypothetical protein